MENLQNFEEKNEEVFSRFEETIETAPEILEGSLKFSWSNWGFGQEDLFASAKRLSDAGIKYLELHGNRYGESLGYEAKEVRKALDEFGLEISGICGMFTPQNDLSSSKGWIRQEAIDYLKRNIELGHELNAEYFLIAPA
ncbi:sugar phosphate isomerase/epimerase, partial [Candidatus Bipolaricaulota bacterium]|nr:sugar phosphate isomerase/epimerase [Candidatus Bipolaricaulota bacterium]